VLSDDEEMTGLFTIGCHPSAAIYALPDAVAELLADFPRIELRFHHDISRRLTEDVVSQRLDFAMVSNPFEHPDLVIKRLYTDQVRVWRAASGRLNPEVLVCDPDMSETMALMQTKPFGALGFRRTIASRNLEYVYALTAAGAGIGVFPAEVACVMGRERVELLPSAKDLAFDCRISLIYRADSVRSKAAKLIVKHLERRLNGGLPVQEALGANEAKSRRKPVRTQS
jgi:DNA-binding transcriptional LysR family regulator